jgi:hypothetical protein
LNAIQALKKITRRPALQISLQRPFSGAAKQNPAFSGFSTDDQRAFGEVYVLKSGILKFAAATACGIEHFKDRAVPSSPGSPYQTGNISLGERPRYRPFRGPRAHQTWRNFVDNPSNAQEVEQRAQTPEVAMNHFSGQVPR